MRTERQKMLAGELYNPLDSELVAMRERARDLCHALNDTRETQQTDRREILQELFGAGGDTVWLQPPFYCDYGSNIYLGTRVFFNFNCIVLDVCEVRIGDFTLFGPGVQILTPLHPLDANLRREQELLVGIVVDSHRMHVTKEHWSDLLISLSRVVGRSIDEIHTRDFYAGNGVWRGMQGPERSEAISAVFNWLSERRHHIVYSSVEKSTYFASLKTGQIPSELTTPWRFMGMHLLLCVQKYHQRQSKNKGHTIFVFDNEEREQMRFTDLVKNPPAWTDSYYGKKKGQTRLDQIIDVPYFGDSKEVGLLQVADFIAYFLRRHVEIAAGYSQPRYSTEWEKLEQWITVLRERCLGGSMMYPSNSRCECAELFYSHAPEVVRTLHRS